ncbi:MAG: right-handed parallel beta-helix repeat-containing protein, partial [Clostridia bacterium]|nr:right-handed parallel beta-helix repeat-containing protein [Clostridia bacterium]
KFNGPSNTSSKPAIQLQKASGVSVDGLKITNNTIDNYTGAGILLNGGGGSGCTVTISGNSISNVSSNGIQALNIENLLIKNNSLSNTGSVFNLYGTQNASFENNRITLQNATQNVLIYVSGMIEFDSSNSVQYAGSEVELTSANCNPGEAAWDDIRMVAVQAGKDSNGQYISGHFVGLESTIVAKLADGVNYSGSEFDWEITIPEATPTIQPSVSPTNTPAPIASSATPAPSAPKTGDNSHIALWTICLLISSVVIFRLCYIHRTQKNKN